jgi:DNA modification methylase
MSGEGSLGDIDLIHGDCLAIMRGMPADSVDAVVTDPPAGISFMGAQWDRFGGRANGNAARDRAAGNRGPGAGLGNQPFAYSGSAVSNPGQRAAFVAFLSAALRACLRVLKPGAYGLVWALPRTSHWTATACEDAGFEVRDRIAHLFGTGFPKGKGCLKPAVEDWWLVRKPGPRVLPLGIDGCRIRAAGPTARPPLSTNKHEGYRRPWNDDAESRAACEARREEAHEKRDGIGRYPANLVLSHADGCNGACVEGCPVAALDAQAGERPGMKRTILRRGATTGTSIGGHGTYGENPPQDALAGYGDTGGASRFFYVAKASRADRGEGNGHPCVKSTALMEWLIKLVCPPGGVVLDPFAGSGSTGVAALRCGRGFVGVERDAGYHAIAERRLAEARGPLFAEVTA